MLFCFYQVPEGVKLQQPLAMILMPLIFATIAIPLIAKFNVALGAEISKPNWNDSLLTLKRPLPFFHFGAYFFIVVGLSMLMGTAIKFQTLNSIGLTRLIYTFGQHSQVMSFNLQLCLNFRL